MADAKDILGLPKSAFAAEKPKKPPKDVPKKPDGVSREVYALTGGLPPIMPALDTSFLKKRPIASNKKENQKVRFQRCRSLGRKMEEKEIERKKIDTRYGTRRWITWQWLSFSSSARKDNLQLYHWVKLVDGVPPTGDYFFARYNKSIDVVRYTEEEYKKIPVDPKWTKQETDQLFELCEQFDLRFIVIADRFHPPRTVEELKSRYYSAAKAVVLARAATPEEAIDHVAVKAHFVPVKKTVKPDHLARLFVAQIFRLHGMPETIVSDRDPRFTSLFWKAIWENIGTRLQFSSSFHPQTDGQSEIANSVVLDLLKSYISDEKTQWERYLPLVEFAYNNTIHSSTGKAPFEIVEGAMKVPPFLSTKDKIFEADEYTRDLDTAFAKARLRKKKGKERLYPKLSMRYYGPFQITERINDVSFRLRLPDTWRIHNAFHLSLLKPFRGDVPDDGEPDEQPEVEENEEILVSEQILAHKDTKTKGKVRRRFLVKFKNYPALDAKWMEEEDLADTLQIVKLYLEAFGLA
ncbi:hypothetical protein L7F22_043056 [Adiantum nelumboides]|nr:hypothetical protein [Adiantum nelumboides]